MSKKTKGERNQEDLETKVDTYEPIVYMGSHRKLFDLDVTVSYPVTTIRKALASYDLDFLMEVEDEWMYITSNDHLHEFKKHKQFASDWGARWVIVNIRSGNIVERN